MQFTISYLCRRHQSDEAGPSHLPLFICICPAVAVVQSLSVQIGFSDSPLLSLYGPMAHVCSAYCILCVVRKTGFNRTTAPAEFQQFIAAKDHSAELQKELKSRAERYQPACLKRGMCALHPCANRHAPLHTHIFRAIRASLAKAFGEKTSKDVLLSGDVILQLCWKDKLPDSEQDRRATASGSTSSSSGVASPRRTSPCEIFHCGVIA